MKKRINLTDKELAIAMWVYIKLYIESAKLCTESPSVTNLKTRFLRALGKRLFYWYNACFLCQRYISEMVQCNCPLSEDGNDCGEGSAWFDVVCYARDEEHRQKALVACDKIIKIMEAENE
jgi:hypothetical protein